MIYTQVEDKLKTQHDLPDLSSSYRLCVDIETFDPNLKKTGPSVRTGGYVCGIGVGAEFEGGKIQGYYIPINHLGHESESEKTEKVIGWLQSLFNHPTREVVFTNCTYDLDYLYSQHNMFVKGPIIDIQLAEPLIDELAYSYALNSLADKYLGESKSDEELYQFCAETFGGKPVRSQASNIYRCPPEVVARYGIGDVVLPLKVWYHQREELSRQGLWDVFNLETALVPMMLEMKKRGVAVDLEKAAQLEYQMEKRVLELQQQVDLECGLELNVSQNSSMLKAYEKLGLPYGRTNPSKRFPEGQPSFSEATLVQSEFGKKVSELKSINKNKKDFIVGTIQKFQVDGRIHPQFNQLKGDEYGTVTGRLSGSKPNLQQTPGAKLVRGLYIPDEGDDWLKLDYNSVEYRLALHYAKGPQADKMRERYNQDAMFDGHRYTASMLYGMGYDDVPKELRNRVKSLTFGLLYGQGKARTADSLGLSLPETEKILKEYNSAVPFMRKLLYTASDRAQEKGFVHTLAGRRRRFNTYEPSKWTPGAKALPLEEAKEKYGPRVKRAYTYKALNAIIQGTAADVMKKAMVDIYKSGVCSEVGIPMLTVHDELDFSTNINDPIKMEAIREVKHLMENAFAVKVPLVVDAEYGPNWGDIKELQL